MKLFVATAAALTLFGSAPAVAQTASYYSVRPVAEMKKASLVTRSTVWKCVGGTCSAGRAAERDSVLCELVAQRAGTLASFTAGGVAFDSDALAKCNAHAR